VIGRRQTVAGSDDAELRVFLSGFFKVFTNIMIIDQVWCLINELFLGKTEGAFEPLIKFHAFIASPELAGCIVDKLHFVGFVDL